MNKKTEYPIRLGLSGVLLTHFLVSLYVIFTGATSIVPLQVGDTFLLSLLLLQAVLGIAILLGDQKPINWLRLFNASENIFLYGLVLFVFAYIFAGGANMDYVQRFAQTSGRFNLAPDTSAERMIAAQRFVPSLLVPAVLSVYARFRIGGRLKGDRSPNGGKQVDRTAEVPGGTLGVFLSVLLSVLSFPSHLSVDGWGWLGWVMFVPLFISIHRVADRQRFQFRVIRHGVSYGVFFILIGNYWLGTFSLVSLQLVGVVFFIFYLLFFTVLALVLPRIRKGRWLVLPLLWTFFDLARSSGFLGYPWLLVGHSQYRFLPVIQYASIGGVWMVGFIVLTVNALLAEGILSMWSNRGAGSAWKHAVVWWGAAGVVFITVVAFGWGLLWMYETRTRDFAGTAGSETRTVRIALIQQNSDPRKHTYDDTFASLRRLTDEALTEDPDLVVWSETAFVPNIRRWSQEDPRRYHLAELVQGFLEYQKQIGTWLLTGNDDYRRVLDADGNEIERLNYNAAVLFDDRGNRRQTYHKIKLVPFTEHFPFKNTFPWIYRFLLDYDVHFWEVGEERTVFEHPEFRFSSPICFEDAFPDHVRRFALAGAEVIVNISNDYWSLTEVAGMQHFVAGMFRSVELSVPVLRSTASGLTGVVDPRGRILDTRPQYSEEYLVTDLTIVPGMSLYRRWGDWFPWVALAMVFILLVINVKRSSSNGS